MTSSTGTFEDSAGPQPFIKTAMVLSLLESLMHREAYGLPRGLQGHVPGKIPSPLG